MLPDQDRPTETARRRQWLISRAQLATCLKRRVSKKKREKRNSERILVLLTTLSILMPLYVFWQFSSSPIFPNVFFSFLVSI